MESPSPVLARGRYGPPMMLVLIGKSQVRFRPVDASGHDRTLRSEMKA